MNIVLLNGRLTKANDFRSTTSGTQVVSNTLAVKRNFKNQAGEYETDFINIVAYNQQAQFINSYCTKGDLIGVQGKWQHRSYTDQNGNKRYVDECIVERVELLAKSETKESPKQETIEHSYQSFPQIDEDDLPF